MVHIGEIQAGFLSHTTFLFVAPDGTVVLTDPYFRGGFEWQGHWERHLQQPDVRPESIRRCDAIFVSHDHGDHFDADAILTIVRNTGARVLAPPDVTDALVSHGLPAGLPLSLRDNTQVQVGAFALTTLGGYDASFDAAGRMNKFSLLLSCGPTRLWFSGDCHSLPPALNGIALDAVFSWTSPDALDAIAHLHPAPDRLVIMHHDRHEPGGFWCSRNAETDAEELRRRMPDTTVLILDRLGSV